MIDLDDLRDIEICRICKHLYMPRMEEDTDYARTLTAMNTIYCETCEVRDAEGTLKNIMKGELK